MLKLFIYLFMDLEADQVSGKKFMHHIYENCCTLGRFGWRKDRDQHLILICVSVCMYAEGAAFLQLLISPFRLTDGCVQAEETTFITDNFTE